MIVNYVEPDTDTGHYAVVIGLENGKIILNDPWNGEGFAISEEEFVRRWQSGDGQFKKWFMAVSKSDFMAGKQYLPRV